jgi:hypothetical protein
MLPSSSHDIDSEMHVQAITFVRMSHALGKDNILIILFFFITKFHVFKPTASTLKKKILRNKPDKVENKIFPKRELARLDPCEEIRQQIN